VLWVRTLSPRERAGVLWVRTLSPRERAGVRVRSAGSIKGSNHIARYFMKQRPNSALVAVKPPLPSSTLANARQLRKAPTDAERRLWACIRSRQIAGLKFRRQHPIPPYVADFCCVEKKLVVELDGSQHSEQFDSTRTGRLEAQGWRLLRFWDNDVLNQTDAVLEAIWNIVESADPHPNPSPGGRGAFERK
jgi:very-short-patch-repair endonuclease